MHPVERHMMAFDGIFGGLSAQQTIAIASLLALFTALAAVAWWLSRRTVVCRPHAVERRAWSYCPKCGWPRPTNGSASSPDPPARPVRDAITAEHPTDAAAVPLPSVLLRRGWTRHAALDAEGRIVTPCDPTAVAWSIWGALNRAFQPGSGAWQAAFRHLADIIAEHEGGCTVSPQIWNRAAGRTHSEILSVSDEIQRRLWLELRPA